MANVCEFEMKVTGAMENVKKALEIFITEYENDEGEFVSSSGNPFIFGTSINEVEEEEHGIIIKGDCAWSVAQCMLDVPSSYYAENKHLDSFNGTTLPLVSEELQLKIEVFSKEDGILFQEHYLIDNGSMIVSEDAEYFEEFDDEEEDYVVVGGIENWGKFSI